MLVMTPQDTRRNRRNYHLLRQTPHPGHRFGGGSTVTRGFEAPLGGICLDMSVHMVRVLDFDEINQTITVQPGIFGPHWKILLITRRNTLAPEIATPAGIFLSPLNIPA